MTFTTSWKLGCRKHRFGHHEVNYDSTFLKARSNKILVSNLIYCMPKLSCVCSVIDHRRRQNVVRTSVTQSALTSSATFFFLPHFDVKCNLLLNRRVATWNLFVKGRCSDSCLATGKGTTRRFQSSN